MRLTPRVLSPVVWGALVVAAMALAASRLEVQNPRGLWTVKPLLPEQELWERAQDQFGEREVLVVTLQLPRDSSRGVESVAVALERWINAQPEVERVIGMELVLDLELRLGPFGRFAIAGLRNAVMSEDRAAVLNYVVLVPPATLGGLEEKAAFLERLESTAPQLLPQGAKLHLAGQPAIDVALDRILSEDFQRTVPLALSATGLPLVVLVGWCSGAILATVIAGLSLLLAGLALAGVPVSTATAVSLPLTVVVGISYSAHVAMAISRHGNRRAALREIRAPLTWSYLTTVVALGSFSVSPIRALRLFSVTSCAGLTIAFLAALTLTPFIWPVLTPDRSRRWHRFLSHVGLSVFSETVRRPRASTITWLVAAVVVIFGALRVDVEPNSYLSFFGGSHPITRAHQIADSAFGGSIQLQILARVEEGFAFRQQRARVRLTEFVRQARVEVPMASALLPPPAGLLTGGEQEETLARWFVGRDRRYTRAILAVPVLPTDELRRVIKVLEGVAAANSDNEVDLHVTGLLPASLSMQDLLVRLMLRSLGLLAVFVVVALAFTMRSIRAGLMLLVPNTIAAAVVLAIMGYGGTPIDFTTISVMSLVLGVAVDDTLQIAWAGRVKRDGGFRPTQAVRRTAAPVLLGSIAMILGSTVLMVSPFAPTARLGGLLAAGLTAALVADLTITPLIITRWSRRRRVT